jgi:flagellar hook-length control protein FliK
MLGLPVSLSGDGAKGGVAKGLVGQETELKVALDGQSSRKKLPGLMAQLAAQTIDSSGGKASAKDFLAFSLGGQAVGQDGVGLEAQALTPVFDKALPVTGQAPVLGAVPVAGQESAMMAARAQAAVPTADRPVFVMQSQFGSAAWQQELGDKLVWMTSRQGQMAELILNPPSLGAVEVRLSLSGGEASAQFFSANPGVRDMLDAALPRLRELMNGAGISLGEATVSDQSFGQRDRPDRPGQGSDTGTADLSDVDEGRHHDSVRVMGRGLLDYFA